MKRNTTPIGAVLASLLFLTAGFFFAMPASAQTTVAKWTFEGIVISSTYTNGLGVVTNVPADIGSGTASGFHTLAGAGQYSTPVGNGSAKSLSANLWTNVPGDYWQFAVNKSTNQNLTVLWDQFGSGTGPRDFVLKYSTDGVTFTQFGGTYTILGSPSWSSVTATALTSYTNDLSSITALNSATTVYFRLVDTSTTSVSGATVGTGGTDRIDNFTVLAFNPVPLAFTQDISNTNTYLGDNLVLSVSAVGGGPITNKWYYPDINTPLNDGFSGYQGNISGSTTPTLTLGYINTNQAGNYQVIVSNPSGSITSQVAQVTVGVRTAVVTNIHYLHSLTNANFALTDTTNLYQVEGVVTTPVTLVSSPGQSFFIQDASGGMDVFFRGSDFAFPAAGDIVRVIAQLEQFGGLLELHAIVTNLTHNVQILSSGNPLPTPQLFDFSSPINPFVMESSVEGSYVIVSNVYLTVTNSDGRMTAGGIVFVTNLTGQAFRLSIPNNVAADPVGNLLPGSPASAPFTIFAASVKGVMNQNATTPVQTNGYSINLSFRSDIEVGTPPPASVNLAVRLVGSSVEISWPTNATGFNLESTTNLTSPISWGSAGSPTQVGTNNVVTISSPTGNQFYRLHQ